MLTWKENKIGSEIVGVGREYAGYLEGKKLLEWDDPANLGTGGAGMILFLASLYRISGENKHLDSIRAMTSDLLGYCRDVESDDYSLYTGRGGVIYILIQVYWLTSEDEWLKAALELMRPSNETYLDSLYTSDYLFDGRAGTLLVILHLYLITKDPVCLNYIQQFAGRIILNARIDADGVSWIARDELNCKNAYGFAYGAAGIRYVLGQLNVCCDTQTIDNIIHGIDKYTASCWVEEYHNWGDGSKDIHDRQTLHRYIQSYKNEDPDLFLPANNYSWAKGTLGLLFAHLGSQAEFGNSILEKGDAVLTRQTIGSRHLYDGLSGLGMYYLQTGDLVQLEKIKNVIAERLTRNSTEFLEIDGGGGLLHSSWGEVYFLMKTIEPGQRENILAPFIDQQPPEPSKIEWNFDEKECRRSWLSPHYPRTFHLIQSCFPAILQKIEMNRIGKPQDFVAGFEHQVGSSLLQDGRNPAGQRLADLFLLEKRKREFQHKERRSNLEIRLSELIGRQQILPLLDRSDEWLKQQTASLSKNVLVTTSKWNWSFVNDFQKLNADANGNLAKPPGEYKYIFQSGAHSQVSELFLRDDLLSLYHCFVQPGRIDQALAGIRSYLTSLPPEVLGNMLQALTNFRNVVDFLAQSDKIALCEIRQWIYRGILIVEDPQ